MNTPLKDILAAIDALEAAWESGDLAGAVRELCNLRDEARQAPPAILKPGAHTPGPWAVEAFTSEDVDKVLNIADQHLIDAEEALRRDGEDAEDIVAMSGKFLAMRPLLAAAPELARALKDCVESLKRLPNVDGAYRVTCLEEAKKVLAAAGIA